MDPLTAFGLASTAFGAIKTAFEHGREIESMIGDIGRWSNAVYDFDAGHQKEKQRLNRFATVEEEALESYLYKQQIKEQENELRNMVNMRFGPQAWQEIVQIQKDIRVERRKAREQAKIDRDEYVYNMCMIGIICFFAAAFLGIVWTIADSIWFS